MRIAPNIPWPTNAPNRFAEIPFQDSLFIDFRDDNLRRGLGRVALDSVMPGAAGPEALALLAPAFDDSLRPEFFG